MLIRVHTHTHTQTKGRKNKLFSVVDYHVTTPMTTDELVINKTRRSITSIY